MLMLLSAGCISISRKKVVPPDERMLPAQTKTKASLLQDLETQSKAVSTLVGRMTLAVSTGSTKSGVIDKYTQTSGLLLVDRPGEIRIQATLLGATVFDMVSDGLQYKASIPINKFLAAPANAPATCENPLYNLRPQNILDALFVSVTPYVSNPRVVPLLEETTSGRNSYYVMTFADVDLPGKNGEILEKTWIDRLSLDVSRRQLFGKDGRLETDAQYSQFETIGGTRFPQTILIERPVEDTSLKITFQPGTLELNGPVTAQQFQLDRPEGSQMIDMESCGKKTF